MAVSADRPDLPVPHAVAVVLAVHRGEDSGDHPGDTAAQGVSEAVGEVEADLHPLMSVRKNTLYRPFWRFIVKKRKSYKGAQPKQPVALPSKQLFIRPVDKDTK